jgi:hypothetical protein
LCMGPFTPLLPLPPCHRGRESVVMDRQEELRVIGGMALAVAAGIARDEAVRTQVEMNDEFDPPELLKLQVFVGEQSSVVAILGPDVAHVLSDEAVRQRVERQMLLPWLGSRVEGRNVTVRGKSAHEAPPEAGGGSIGPIPHPDRVDTLRAGGRRTSTGHLMEVRRDRVEKLAEHLLVHVDEVQ